MRNIRIVEIKALSNGSHRNQSGIFDVIPDGWAVIPDDIETKNFPFGELTAEKVNGVLTVTKWIPGTIPEVPKSEAPITTEERLAALEAAMLEMVIGGTV